MNLHNHSLATGFFIHKVLEFLADHQGQWSLLFDNKLMPTNSEEYLFFGALDTKPLAIMRLLHRYGMVGGCTCGCRGDFEITDKGLLRIDRKRVRPYTGY